jgi:hypothetical protein
VNPPIEAEKRSPIDIELAPQKVPNFDKIVIAASGDCDNVHNDTNLRRHSLLVELNNLLK